MFEKSRVGTIIFTSVSVDGTLNGPSVEKIINLVKTVKVPIVASGGVSSLDDLVALALTGAVGAVIGTALYERKFTLEQALEAIEKC
jgi:phosphoribosylformimino-5-aminoimidazole carboxamide ribotide isomerase